MAVAASAGVDVTVGVSAPEGGSSPEPQPPESVSIIPGKTISLAPRLTVKTMSTRVPGVLRPAVRPLLLRLLAVTCVAVACGKSSSPTGPDGYVIDPATEAAVAASATSYVASVTLPGRTGVLVVNTSGSAAWLPRTDALAVLLDLVEPRVLAQGATAGGTLALDDGTAVWLTGSGGGGNLQLSGPGGYSVTASIAGGVLSGTVSGPGGAGTVRPLVPVTPLAVDPGDPNGLFEATYALTTSGYFRNINASNQTIQRDCGYAVELNGTLRIDVPGHSFPNGGYRRMQFRNSWRETRTILPPCPGATNFSPTVFEESEGRVLEIVGRRAKDVHQFGIETKFNGANGSTVSRIVAFVGAYTSENTIHGTVLRMANNIVPTNAGHHMNGFPPVQTAVTFLKVQKYTFSDARRD